MHYLIANIIVKSNCERLLNGFYVLLFFQREDSTEMVKKKDVHVVSHKDGWAIKKEDA